MSKATGAPYPESEPGSVKDPVCGMQVNPSEAEGQARHEGQMYYFCSTECRDQFARNPEEYVSDSSS